MARKFTRSHMEDFTRIAESASVCAMLVQKQVDISNDNDDNDESKEFRTVIAVSPMDDARRIQGPSFELPFDSKPEFSNIRDHRSRHRWFMSFCAFLTAMGSSVHIRVNKDEVVEFDPENHPEDIRIFNPQEIAEMIMRGIEPVLITDQA